MANQNPLFRPGGFQADADLSAKQYYFVKLTGDEQVGLCDTDGELPFGVLQNEPSESGAAASVETDGVSKVVFGEAITAGQLVGTDANGKAKVVEASNTGADIGDWAFGVCTIGAGADEVGSVKLGLAHKVEAA